MIYEPNEFEHEFEQSEIRQCPFSICAKTGSQDYEIHST